MKYLLLAVVFVATGCWELLAPTGPTSQITIGCPPGFRQAPDTLGRLHCVPDVVVTPQHMSDPLRNTDEIDTLQASSIGAESRAVSSAFSGSVRTRVGPVVL